jgi:hypothetical protein
MFVTWHSVSGKCLLVYPVLHLEALNGIGDRICICLGKLYNHTHGQPGGNKGLLTRYSKQVSGFSDVFRVKGLAPHALLVLA